VWSPGKDAEHVADGGAYHLWTVRASLGQRVSGRPRIERDLPVAQASAAGVAALIRERSADAARLIGALGDAELDLPTHPIRARPRSVAEFIERTLVRHYHVHREAIETKLQARSRH
jgi:hypothetical protein